MEGYNNFKHINESARKNNRIEYLQRKVKEASMGAAIANSTYNSLVEKAAIFASLDQEAAVDVETTEGYWNLFLKVKSDIQVMTQIAGESNLTVVGTLQDVRNLISAWEAVTSETLKAAESIVIMSEYIQKRKANNPLISNDLVADAIAAAKAAEKTVNIVLQAFTDALNTLSVAAQANNSTALRDVYKNLAITLILENNHQKGLLGTVLKAANINPTISRKIEKMAKNGESLETSLSNSLKAAKRKVKLSQIASENVNKEMNKAKEELALAQAVLATWEAALVAAETATGG